MINDKSITPGRQDYKSLRGVRHSMKVVFSCLTAIPFFVFGFIYFRIGTLNIALTGSLIALALILILEGFIVFRRMAEHIEQLSSSMVQIEGGKISKIKKEGDTRELAIIADTFNRTLDKLDDTARQLSKRVAQASTLNEISEAVSKTINIGKITKIILEMAQNASDSKAGYIALRPGKSNFLYISASVGLNGDIKGEIELDKEKTLAGLVFHKKAPTRIDDTGINEPINRLNVPDLGLPRLLYLPIAIKGTPIGVLVLARDLNGSPYQDEEIFFIQTLLRQAGSGIENARLYENIQQYSHKLESALVSQKKAQAHLLSSARMTAFGELSINVAHELNNPLTGIMGYSDLMLSSPMDDNEKRKYLEEIRDQAIKAGNIIKGLLDFADSRSTGSWTDLNSLIEKALLLVKGRMIVSNIRLDLDLESGLPLVKANQNEMEQVFLNLINNAINSMSGIYKSGLKEDHGEIKQYSLKITTKNRGDQIHIDFKDNGQGMDPQEIPRIFEPFYSTKKEISQVGLGLWVNHRIVTANKGIIQVKTKVGEGSLFSVILPLSKRELHMTNHDHS